MYTSKLASSYKALKLSLCAGHGKGDAKMDDFKKASPTGAAYTNRNVSKVNYRVFKMWLYVSKCISSQLLCTNLSVCIA